MLCRCARHFFQTYIQNVEVFCTGAAVAHFLNCLLGASSETFTTEAQTLNNGLVNPENGTIQLLNGVPTGKKSNKKKKNKLPVSNSVNINSVATSINSTKGFNLEWKKLSVKSLWKALAEDSKKHFDSEILVENADQFLQWTGSNRTAILRRICNLAGIQLLLKV